MLQHTVSIVIPCFNGARWIQEAMDSCLAQSHRPVEVIVVDDGSTDNSFEICRRYAHTHGSIVRLLQQANQGAPTARNAGAAIAKGEFIAFLDADDILCQDALLHLVEALHSGSDVAYGNIEFVDEYGRTISVRDQSPLSDDWVVFAIENGAWNSSRLIRRGVLSRCMWDPNLPCKQDYEFLVNCAIQGFKFSFVPKIVAKVREHDSPTRISARSRNSVAPYDVRAALHQRFEVELARTGNLTAKRKASLQYSLLDDAVFLWRYGRHEKARKLFSAVDLKSARRCRYFKFLSYNGIASVFGPRFSAWVWEARRRLPV